MRKNLTVNVKLHTKKEQAANVFVKDKILILSIIVIRAMNIIKKIQIINVCVHDHNQYQMIVLFV